MNDLVVIGAGLSGLMAAFTAAKQGLRVRVVAKGLGSMHWGAGTIDVLGYAPDAPDEPVKRPFEAIKRLVASRPAHPYGLLPEAQLPQTFATFLALTKGIGVPYDGADTPGENLLLPSPAGGVRPAYLAPKGQRAGDLHRADPLLIVGFDGMRDFFPHLIAANLSKQGYRARAATLPMSTITDRIDANTVQLAHGLDSKERRLALAAALRRLARPGERIGLPAILGMAQHLTLLAELERETKTAVFEIPTLPPSVPGIRLFTALRTHLRSMGVRIEAGMEVVRAEMTAPNGVAGDVKWVESASSARPVKHRAPKFLLATGGILGGGFNSDQYGRVQETIFNLPLTIPQRRADWFRPTFLDPVGHPVFHGGVRVDASFQPVGPDGSLLYRNLWAAGNQLAASDAIQERSMEGAAIATGVAAAQALSR